MKRQVLVVGHADADGHVIAEQVRRNLGLVRTFEITTVVDPNRTKDHKTWLHLNALSEIETCELVFFVDLMFAPASFNAEADALVQFAKDRPTKQFFVLDHHPMPLRLLSMAPNLRALYRQDVLDCTIGPASQMMIVAALCEKQSTRAHEIKDPTHDVLAKGVRRAAALGGSLPGKKLSALLRFDRWKDIEELGREEASEHYLPRGRRRSGEPPSKMLAQLDKTATDLLNSALSQGQEGMGPMSYDFDAVTDRRPPTRTRARVVQPNDLEAIVMLLELAAIYLTSEPGSEFTFDELLDQARAIGGDDLVIERKDAEIVLDKASFLKKHGKRLRLK